MLCRSVVSLCNLTNCSPPGSSIHGISQARILEWGAISSSRGQSQPREEPASPALAGGFFTLSLLGSPQAPGQLDNVFVPGPKVRQALPSSAGPSVLPKHQGEGSPVSTLSRVPGKVVAQWPVPSPASSPEGEQEKRASVPLPEDTWVSGVNYLFS